MAFLDTAPADTIVVLDPNRPDAAGMALSALLPLAAVVVLGTLAPASAWPVLPLPVPGWVQTLAILFLFPMWGVARWMVARSGSEGRAASWWAVGLMGVMLAYPYVAAHTDSFFLGWLNLATLLLAITATARVGAVSPKAMIWMLPAIVILGLGAIQGYVFLTNGWSPGFAVTAAIARREP